MRPLLLIAILFLAGCYGQGPAYYSYEGMQLVSLQQCERIANAHSFTGDTRRQYMALCVGIGGGSSVPMAQVYPLGRTQYSTIGQPDPFGPLGYRGPTWESYNQFFANPPQR